jgi:hypothetical protein
VYLYHLLLIEKRTIEKRTANSLQSTQRAMQPQQQHTKSQGQRAPAALCGHARATAFFVRVNLQQLLAPAPPWL